MYKCQEFKENPKPQDKLCSSSSSSSKRSRTSFASYKIIYSVDM